MSDDQSDYDEAIEQVRAHQRPTFWTQLLMYNVRTVLKAVRYGLIALTVTVSVMWVLHYFGVV